MCLRRSAVWGASIWGTEGRRFKSSQPDNKNHRSGGVVGPLGWGGGQWFSEAGHGWDLKSRELVTRAPAKEPISNNGKWLASSPVRLGPYPLPST